MHGMTGHFSCQTESVQMNSIMKAIDGYQKVDAYMPVVISLEDAVYLQT